MRQQHALQPITLRRRWLPAVTLAVWVLLVWLVLRPRPPLEPVNCWVICSGSAVTDILANVLAFGVATFLLVRSGVRWWPAALLGVALVLVAEFLQWTVLQGRDPNVVDLATGSFGAVVGAMMAAIAWRGVRPSRRRMILMGVWFGWQGWMALTVWAFLPVVGPAPYSVVVTPAGHATGIEVDAQERHESFLIDGRFRAPEPGRYRTLAVLLDRNGWIAEVAVSWRGLVVGTRLRGGALGLATPGLHLIRTLPPEGGGPVAFTAWRSPREWHLDASRAGWAGVEDVVPSPLWGWALLYPGRYAMGWERHVFTGLYGVLLALFLGLTTRWAVGGRPLRLILVGLATVAFGLGAMPMALGSAAAVTWHWLVVLGGYVLGVARLPRPRGKSSLPEVP
jgi:VanZ family protein